MVAPRRWSRLIVPAVLVLAGTATPLVARAAEPRLVVSSPAPVPAGDAVVTPPTTGTFDVALRQPNAAALRSFLTALTTPGSPDYRHFLTTAQFAERFGAPASEAAAVREYFTSFGLRVGPLSRGHILLHVSGPSSAISHAFATSLIGVRRADHSVAAQFGAPATLPSSIAHDVAAIAGLDTVVAPHAQSLRHYSAGAHVTTPTTCGPATGGAAPTSTTPNSLGGYTLQQQAQLYGLSNVYAKGYDGTGQTIAVYELEGYNASDVATFAQCYGLSPSITNVSVDGASSAGNGNEATLDIEEALGLAPGASIVVYTGPNNSAGPTDIYQQIADDNTASIVTTSWGTCEADPNGAPGAEQAIFEQMAAQGQTVVAAAGDNGSSDCNGIVNNQPAVDDPASQPFVTGVGGLSVTNIAPLTQTVWNDAAGSAGSGSGGGGISQIWSRPSWQTAPGITSSETMRLVPDLSVMGDPATGFIEYFPTNGSPSWGSIGGTSIGSPIVASMLAVGAQSCGTARLGFVNPSLYRMATTGYVDVTTGNNDLYGVGVYNAGPGYDMASGLGSPNPQTFYAGLCPSALDAAKTIGTVSSSRVATNATSTVSFTLQDQSAQPMTNLLVSVDATAASGRVILNGDPSSITGSGQAHYSVTTNAAGTGSVTVANSVPGPVTVNVSYQSQPLYSTVITVLASGATPLPRAAVSRVAGLTRAARVSVRPPQLPAGQSVTRYQYSLNGGANWVSVTTATFTIPRLAPGVHRVIVRYLVGSRASAVSAPVRVAVRS